MRAPKKTKAPWWYTRLCGGGTLDSTGRIMDTVAEPSVSVKPRLRRYDPHAYPLPELQPYQDMTGRLMFLVASSGLSRNERLYLLFVLARINPETWHGLFEFHQLKAALGFNFSVCQGVQASLFRKGIVTWTRREEAPAPLTLHLHALINLPPYTKPEGGIHTCEVLKTPPDYINHVKPV